jgi:hypothetical protein
MDNLGSVIGRQASLPQDEDRGAYNFKDCEANERDRRWSSKMHGNAPADATEKNHAPDNPEQDGLSLDSGNEPIQSEAQSQPHSTKKPQIAVEQRVCCQACRRIDWIVQPPHSDDACHDGDDSKNAGYNLKDAFIHRVPMLLYAKLSEERKEEQSRTKP